MFVLRKTGNVFMSCCASNFLMEILMFRYPKSSNLITFLQFLFVTIQGLFTTVKFGTVSSSIPLQQYILLVILFFITSTANNFVYTLHVSSTLHMIIRSASLPASMLMSWLLKGRKPKVANIFGSIILTAGIMFAIYGGSKIVGDRTENLMHWCLGVAILLTSLFTGAYTGLLQERLFEKYGKHPKEMMFYINALPLPFFALLFSSIYDGARDLDRLGWIVLVANMLSQFFCLYFVHELATNETSVTVTLILTLRKFMSLLLSAVVFQSNFTLYHFIGTVLVILGTAIYFGLITRRSSEPISIVKEKRAD